MPTAHIIKIEDARTGQWLRHLDPTTDPIRRIDMGWTMGDWNQLDVTTETVGLREPPCLSSSRSHTYPRRLAKDERLGTRTTRPFTSDMVRCRSPLLARPGSRPCAEYKEGENDA